MFLLKKYQFYFTYLHFLFLIIEFVSNVHESSQYDINGGVFILNVFAYFG
jgi:hypothetical protein